MPITSGAHHVALFTRDLDRLLRFYEQMFDAETRYDLTEQGPGGGMLRHALVDLGGGFSLHPFQMPEPTGFEEGSMAMGRRGHIDHLALRVADENALQMVRRRLYEAGASDGVVTDFGAVRLVAFRDPDGMEGEVALWTGKARALAFADRSREELADG
jgi:catechol 2,3-dioxygenase-like lactoylglutathione lyase family enzyme